MKLKTFTFAVLSAATLFSSCSKETDSIFTKDEIAIVTSIPRQQKDALIFSSGGDIYPAFGNFIDNFGGPLNTAPGGFPNGWRHIHWGQFPVPFNSDGIFPGDYFNSTNPDHFNSRKRGVILSTPGNYLRVSDENFTDIESTYRDEFNSFSSPRMFSAIGSNIVDVTFKVPGTNTDGWVHGFGVVLIDVDNGASTLIEYFSGNESLGIFMALPGRTEGHSFMGVYFPDKKITRVRITCGSGILAPGNKDLSDGGGKDIVVMGDIVYDEPKAL